jgi:hypothetical protein
VSTPITLQDIPFFPGKPRLMIGVIAKGGRKRRMPLFEEPAAKRDYPPERTVDFGVQRADENKALKRAAIRK